MGIIARENDVIHGRILQLERALVSLPALAARDPF